MALKKSEREIVFNKYSGRCAYCGCELGKGWHVDHIKAVVRRKKRVAGHWSEGYHPGMSEQEIIDNGVKWVDEKYVFDRYEKPNNHCLENMMPSCAACNIQKHSQSVEDFRKNIEGFINSLNQYYSIYRFAKKYGLVEETNKPVVFYFEKIKSNIK